MVDDERRKMGWFENVSARRGLGSRCKERERERWKESSGKKISHTVDNARSRDGEMCRQAEEAGEEGGPWKGW